ncbi:MAG: hypothetical protein FIA96_03385 [Betaproteobacteria bacterium]|nr:hypothetical protein [Betaproteobacteria bacterium]
MAETKAMLGMVFDRPCCKFRRTGPESAKDGFTRRQPYSLKPEWITYRFSRERTASPHEFP